MHGRETSQRSAVLGFGASSAALGIAAGGLAVALATHSIGPASALFLGLAVLGLAVATSAAFRAAAAPAQPPGASALAGLPGEATRELFIAVLSHELRSSLTAMVGWLEIGRSRIDDLATVRRAFDVALRNARQQSRMMDDLLDVSRMMTGRFALERRPVDLSRVAREALEGERPAAEQLRIELRARIQEPVFVEGDRGRLAQVVGNLLDNALKFNHAAGWVELVLERSARSVRLAVLDGGAGIDADALPHVFEPFWQGRSAGPLRRRGLGLGLALVRHIVELHGGRIEAQSDGTGRGCRVTIELPAIADAAAALAAEARGGAEDTESLNGLGVVAVDENDDTLGWLQYLFAMHGAMTWKARSVEEAVSLAEREHADVMISDVAVVDERFELVRRLRLRQPARAVAAVAFSSRPTEEACRRALSAGYDSFIAKPCDPGVLLRAVKAAAQRRSA
jgi:signal transduction histidine kinase